MRNQGLVGVENGREVLKRGGVYRPAKIEAVRPQPATLPRYETVCRPICLKVRSASLFTMLAADAPRHRGERGRRSCTDRQDGGVPLPLSEPFAELAQGKIPKVLNPRFTAAQIGVFDAMKGAAYTPFNWELFLNADSRFPERAGLAGAITGTFLMLLVCFGLSFPIGIAAAVYLEEFAPRTGSPI